MSVAPAEQPRPGTLGTVANQPVAYDLVDKKPDTEGILTRPGR